MNEPSNKDLLNWVGEGMKEKVLDFLDTMGSLTHIAVKNLNLVRGVREYIAAVNEQNAQMSIAKYGVFYHKGSRPLTDRKAIFALRRDKEVFDYIKERMGEKDPETGKRRMSFAQVMKGEWPETFDKFRSNYIKDQGALIATSISTRDPNRDMKRGEGALYAAQSRDKKSGVGQSEFIPA